MQKPVGKRENSGFGAAEVRTKQSAATGTSSTRKQAQARNKGKMHEFIAWLSNYKFKMFVRRILLSYEIFKNLIKIKNNKLKMFVRRILLSYKIKKNFQMLIIVVNMYICCWRQVVRYVLL